MKHQKTEPGLKQWLVNVHHGNSVERESNSCLFLNWWKDLICEMCVPTHNTTTTTQHTLELGLSVTIEKPRRRWPTLASLFFLTCTCVRVRQRQPPSCHAASVHKTQSWVKSNRTHKKNKHGGLFLFHCEPTFYVT